MVRGGYIRNSFAALIRTNTRVNGLPFDAPNLEPTSYVAVYSSSREHMLRIRSHSLLNAIAGLISGYDQMACLLLMLQIRYQMIYG